jgi:hypothetical protein
VSSPTSCAVVPARTKVPVTLVAAKVWDVLEATKCKKGDDA